MRPVIRDLNELKAKTAAVVDHVVRTRRPVLITRRGRGVAVLVELSEFERMQDELAFRKGVERGLQDVRAGDVADHAEAATILRSFGSRPRKKSKRGA